MIQIKNSAGTPKYTINAAISSAYHRAVNGECTFALTMPSKRILGIDLGDVIEDTERDLLYDVVRISKQTQVTSVIYDVEAEHVSYRLNGKTMTDVDLSGTAAQILTSILSGTGLTVGSVGISGTYHLQISGDTSARDALTKLASLCEAELSYSGMAIGLVEHLGSSSPVLLSETENVKSISVVLDSRSPTQSYDVELSRLQTIDVGDEVQIKYDSLSVDATERVISIDYDVFRPSSVSIVVGEYVPEIYEYIDEEIAEQVEEATDGFVEENVPYYGVTISEENGIEIDRSDDASRAIFNADTFAMYAKEGSSMVPKIYFDPDRGNYVFDGVLGADAIYTQSLYAETGFVAELTVDQLSTSRRVRKYLLNDTSDDNYVYIHEQIIELRTGSNASGRVQAANRYGQPLYWAEDISEAEISEEGFPFIDGKQIYTATDNTGYPVYTYEYDELTKMKIEFQTQGSVYVPVLTIGAGDLSGNNIAQIYKGADGLHIDYKNAGGTTDSISHSESEPFWRLNGYGIQAVGSVPASPIHNVIYLTPEA